MKILFAGRVMQMREHACASRARQKIRFAHSHVQQRMRRTREASPRRPPPIGGIAVSKISPLILLSGTSNFNPKSERHHCGCDTTVPYAVAARCRAKCLFPRVSLPR